MSKMLSQNTKNLSLGFGESESHIEASRNGKGGE
jgi:hypothetical protein